MGFVFSRINPADPFDVDSPSEYDGIKEAMWQAAQHLEPPWVAIRIEECIDLLLELIQEFERLCAADDPEGNADRMKDGSDAGSVFIDFLNDRHSQGLAPLRIQLNCGTEFTENETLAAFALRQCELTAQAIDARDVAKVALLMWDLHELMLAIGALEDENTSQSHVVFNARKAAIARHAEHRAMKAQVLQHYRENQQSYRSKDAAAETIAGKLVPMPFRTVRDWLKNA